MSTNTISDCGCTTSGCGIGGWNGPKPGDPDNSSRITAQSVVGGIQVNWSYPSLNPHAVAYFTLFRSTTNEFAGSTHLGQVAGGHYLDLMTVNEPQMFYYWIQMTSVNGTTETPIGPAWATARPFKDDVNNVVEVGERNLDAGMGKIIDRITLNYNELTNRMGQLAANDAAAAQAWDNFEKGITQQLYYAFNKMDVVINGQTVMRTDLEAIALANKQAAILIENNRKMLVDTNQALYTETQNRNLAFQNMATAYKKEIKDVADAMGARTSQIETWQSGANNRLASVQQSITTQANKMGQLEATYLLKLSNGMITGGMGMALANNRISIGFYANNFYIKDPASMGSDLGLAPFRVINGRVIMQNVWIGRAVIEELAVGSSNLDYEAAVTMTANTSSGRGTTPSKVITLVSKDVRIPEVYSTTKVAIFGTYEISIPHGQYIGEVWTEIIRRPYAGGPVTTIGQARGDSIMVIDYNPAPGINLYEMNFTYTNSANAGPDGAWAKSVQVPRANLVLIGSKK